MIIYGIPNCNTVKKAIDWLKNNSFEYEFHDFKKKGITEEKLNSWCNTFGDDVVLNKKGLTWKKLTKEEQQLINSRAKIVSYLMQQTSAIKRPIVEIDNKPVLISFDEEKYKQILL